MYDGYVRTTRVLIWQEIMEILSLRSSAMLIPPIFYFSYFAMNIKATCLFLSLLASNTCILSKKLIKVLSSCTKSKINNHFIMVMGNFSCSIHERLYNSYTRYVGREHPIYTYNRMYLTLSYRYMYSRTCALIGRGRLSCSLIPLLWPHLADPDEI